MKISVANRGARSELRCQEQIVAPGANEDIGSES